jgi:uncharacterized membrane protein YbhN (UPF0104 family)
MANVLDWLATTIIGIGSLKNLYDALDREAWHDAIWAMVIGVIVLAAVWR